MLVILLIKMELNPRKNVEAIQQMPNIKELEAFIGKINYYNKFILNFAKTAGPLNELRRSNAKFI